MLPDAVLWHPGRAPPRPWNPQGWAGRLHGSAGDGFSAWRPIASPNASRVYLTQVCGTYPAWRLVSGGVTPRGRVQSCLGKENAGKICVGSDAPFWSLFNLNAVSNGSACDGAGPFFFFATFSESPDLIRSTSSVCLPQNELGSPFRRSITHAHAPMIAPVTTYSGTATTIHNRVHVIASPSGSLLGRSGRTLRRPGSTA